MKLIIYDTAG